MFYVKTIELTVLFVFLFGICSSGIRTITYSVIMKIVPNSYLGRTMSILNIISLGLQVIVTYAIGKVMDRSGASYGFLVYSLIMAIGAIIYYSSSKFSNEENIVQ
ncbi:MAG: hypothetical protein PHX70_10495 [Clostridium sp.]|nr:hypothetical protein [Clostridium sp.]